MIRAYIRQYKGAFKPCIRINKTSFCARIIQHLHSSYEDGTVVLFDDELLVSKIFFSNIKYDDLNSSN